jgi:glucose/mannose transport system substrate-binding protein
MDLAKFDDCAKASAKDFAASAQGGTLVPSIAHGMAVPAAVEGAIKDVISQFWNNERMTPKEAMTRLTAAAKAS